MPLEQIASESKVVKLVIQPVSREIEKNYMRSVLADYQKEHPIRAYFKKFIIN